MRLCNKSSHKKISAKNSAHNVKLEVKNFKMSLSSFFVTRRFLERCERCSDHSKKDARSAFEKNLRENF